MTNHDEAYEGVTPMATTPTPRIPKQLSREDVDRLYILIPLMDALTKR